MVSLVWDGNAIFSKDSELVIAPGDCCCNLSSSSSSSSDGSSSSSSGGGCNDSCRLSCSIIGAGQQNVTSNNINYFRRSRVQTPTNTIVWQPGYPAQIEGCYYFWWYDFARASDLLNNCSCYKERYRLYLVDCDTETISNITSTAVVSLAFNDPGTGDPIPQNDLEYETCFNTMVPQGDPNRYTCTRVSLASVPAYYNSPDIACIIVGPGF